MYPTDTLYGLGADPGQEEALDRLFAAKGRPGAMPVSLTVGAVDDLWRYGRATPLARALARRHLPGPLTLLLRPNPGAPAALVGPEGLLGLRVPDHAVARALATAFGPLTATSANRHGAAPPRTVEDAAAQLGDAVALYLDAGPTPYGAPSTVVDASGESLRVLREGVLSADALATGMKGK